MVAVGVAKIANVPLYPPTPTPEITTVSPAAKLCVPTVVMVAVVPASVALAIRLELAEMIAWSTVAWAEPRPLVPPALNVAVAWALAFRVSGCAWGMVPSTGVSNVIGSPTMVSRFPARAAPLP